MLFVTKQGKTLSVVMLLEKYIWKRNVGGNTVVQYNRTRLLDLHIYYVKPPISLCMSFLNLRV